MATSKAPKKSKVPPKPSAGPLSNAARKQPGATRRLHAQGVQTIESVLGKGKDPVLGLYLHTVHILLIKDLGRNPRFRSIMPHLIGTPSILSKHPGLSQVELAAFLGTERATAGLQVSQCLKHGFVRRAVSKHDRRRYELFVTPKGLRLLEDARNVIPEHEDLFAGSLTASERNTLRRLLLRLISG
jgi:DNA-binding MarR family transcriptional regulator